MIPAEHGENPHFFAHATRAYSETMKMLGAKIQTSLAGWAAKLCGSFGQGYFFILHASSVTFF